ncbi:diguanylate cyclase [Sphingomonas sp. GB1N7]
MSAILRFLAEQGLRPTPVNYELAYIRANDGQSLAARAIDAILIGGDTVSQAQADHIVGAYRALGGGDQREQDEETAGHAELRHQTRHLAELTGAAMTATGQFGRDLSQHLDELDLDQPPLAAAIAAMIDRTGETEARLNAAMEQIDSLNSELMAAKNDAARDALTGLANRRGLQLHLDALEPGGCTAIAICDIDRFKTINDRHGHQVGDRVIKAVADSIAGSCEPHLVARWGGEEFVVVMEGVPLAAAADIIERSNRSLQNRVFRVRDSGEALEPITLSAGVVMVEDGKAEEAINAADALLYRAKMEGRDRVLWTACPLAPPAALAA